MTNAVHVRAATPQDCAVLARLVTQLGYPADNAAMQQRFAALGADPQSTTFVAECDGEVCGLLGVNIVRVWHYDAPTGHLATVVVDAGHRDQGVGAILLAAAEDWLRARGVQHVVLTSATRRSDAHRFYLKHGYALTGQRFAKSL